eukprot:226905-Pleurochrysis_carterae.AAC.2
MDRLCAIRTLAILGADNLRRLLGIQQVFELRRVPYYALEGLQFEVASWEHMLRSGTEVHQASQITAGTSRQGEQSRRLAKLVCEEVSHKEEAISEMITQNHVACAMNIAGLVAAPAKPGHGMLLMKEKKGANSSLALAGETSRMPQD